MLGDQSYGCVVDEKVAGVAGTSSQQATAERCEWHGDAGDGQRLVSGLCRGGGSLDADGAGGLDTLNF